MCVAQIQLELFGESIPYARGDVLFHDCWESNHPKGLVIVIRELHPLHVVSARWGGTPTVMRFDRVGAVVVAKAQKELLGHSRKLHSRASHPLVNPAEIFVARGAAPV